jgi:hypothetical protein
MSVTDVLAREQFPFVRPHVDGSPPESGERLLLLVVFEAALAAILMLLLVLDQFVRLLVELAVLGRVGAALLADAAGAATATLLLVIGFATALAAILANVLAAAIARLRLLLTLVIGLALGIAVTAAATAPAGRRHVAPRGAAAHLLAARTFLHLVAREVAAFLAGCLRLLEVAPAELVRVLDAAILLVRHVILLLIGLLSARRFAVAGPAAEIVVAVRLAVRIDAGRVWRDDLPPLLAATLGPLQILRDLIMPRFVALGERVALAVHDQTPSSGSIGRRTASSIGRAAPGGS